MNLIMVTVITIHYYNNDLPESLVLEGDLAIDTEATGLHLNRDRLCVLQISNGDGNAHLVKFDLGSYEAPNLKKLLSNPKTCKIFHYGRFDIAMIYKFLNIELKNIYCTKIASKIARTYTDGHGLKDICRELLGVNISKQQQCSYWGAAELSKEQQEYAASDVLHLHALRKELNSMLEREDRQNLVEECFEFLPMRAKLDVLGWGEVDIFSHR
jgi:ribonuclease D